MSCAVHTSGKALGDASVNRSPKRPHDLLRPRKDVLLILLHDCWRSGCAREALAAPRHVFLGVDAREAVAHDMKLQMSLQLLVADA